MSLCYFGNQGKLWFFEDLYPDCTYGFEVSEILFGPQRSDFQEILVLNTPKFGRALILDQVVQFLERDERLYHEMMAHPTVVLAPDQDSKSILVVGGGDGGIARELVKHHDVGEIIVADIDPMVTEISRKYFGDLFAEAFDDPRVIFRHVDAAEYIHSQSNLSSIIVDSTDPVGTAEPLFGIEFVNAAKEALRNGGVFVRHSGSLLLQSEEFQSAWADMLTVFGEDAVRVSLIAPIMYQGGYFTSIVAIKKEEKEVFKQKVFNAKKAFRPTQAIDTEWYTQEFYQNSLGLPRFLTDNIVMKRNP